MISLLVVNYRSAALAADAVRTARAASSAPLQVVIVDNSRNDAEAERLRTFADLVIVADENRGYAGGINLGRPSCDGDPIVISNPDVTFGPAAIDLLVAALDERTAVAGPALFWDDAYEWMLPPGDLNTTAEKLDEVLASRSRAWFEHRDRRRIRNRVAFWSLDARTEVDVLSGAVMAVRTADFDAAGGFDERFRLYFEEVDFLRRVSAGRRRIVYVPAARCRHLYNQSAQQDRAAADAAYVESEQRYLEKWSGPFAARVLRRAGRAPLSAGAQTLDGPIRVERPNALVEVSPLPTFVTAAGHFAKSGLVEVPREITASVGAAPLYVRVVDRS